MPTFSEAANAIRDRFKTEFHARRSDPIAFDNFDKLINEDGSLRDEPKDSNGDPVNWVRLSIRPGDAFQVEVGNTPTYRQPGAVIVQIFIVAGTGDGPAQQIGDDVAASLRGVTVSGVRILAVSPPQFVGPDGAWWQANARCDFEFDDS